MATEQSHQQPSLAAAISDSLHDVISGRISSFIQSLEASSDSPNVSKAMSSWTVPSDAETGARSLDDDMDTDEMLALTLEAEELAAVKVAAQETTPAAQAGAKSSSHSHKHSCTVDGTCTRDLWLRGMMTLACASIILLS